MLLDFLPTFLFHFLYGLVFVSSVLFDLSIHVLVKSLVLGLLLIELVHH